MLREIMKPIEWLAHRVLAEELRLKDETIGGLCGQLEHVRTKLNRTANHRDQLAQHLHDIGAAKEWKTRQELDKAKGADANLQLFCPTCKIGVGDDEAVKAGDLKKCPQCGGTEFRYSWEFEL